MNTYNINSVNNVNEQKKSDKKTNNDPQNNRQKTRD